MSYSVTVSSLAASLMGESIAFLARVDEKAAEALRKNLVNAISSLSSMPDRYPFLDDPCLTRNKYRKMVVGSRFLLLYLIKGSEVSVEYVLDCRKSYSWLIG